MLAKKPRTEALSSKLPARPQAKSQGVSRAAVAGELHKYDKILTPYGPLLQNLVLGLLDGSVHVVLALNPMAMIWFIALSDPVGAFLVG